MSVEWASVPSVLRPCSVDNTRSPVDSFAGHVHHRFAWQFRYQGPETLQP